MFGPQTIALPNFLVADLAPALSQQRLILCGANTLSVGDDFIILLLFNFFSPLPYRSFGGITTKESKKVASVSQGAMRPAIPSTKTVPCELDMSGDSSTLE